MIKAIFQNKLVTDDRSPILTFTLAGKNLGVYMLEPLFWIQILVCLAITGVVSFAIWAAIYYIIILPNQHKSRDSKTSASVSAFLIGFGLMGPFIAMYPFWVLDFLDIQNFLIRFCFSAIYPLISFFRVSEAVFGYTPKLASDTFKNYALYNACVLNIEYEQNPKTDKMQPIKTSMNDHIAIIRSFGSHVISIGLFMSIFAPYSYEPFPTDANGNQAGFDLKHFVDFNLFLNNLVCAIFFQIMISTFTIALSGVASVLYGVKTSGAMRNPVFEATSAADFWGRRWNLIVHGALKRGVFKPMYRFSSSKGCAVLASFLASGLFHEYLICVVYAARNGAGEEEAIGYGKNTAFMLWNAGIVTIEFLFGEIFLFQSMKKNLPRPLVTFLIISMALPVAHWFIHPYVKNGFFDDLQVGFPMIKEIPEL